MFAELWPLPIFPEGVLSGAVVTCVWVGVDHRSREHHGQKSQWDKQRSLQHQNLPPVLKPSFRLTLGHRQRPSS